MLSHSEADTAYSKLRKIVESHQLFRYDDPRISEADVRAKLIDPLFKEVLCWSESDIRREKPSSSGFADYLLGSDAAYLLVEAKRTNPRFRLQAPSKPRKLQLEGPHLLGQKKMREPLEQAQRYASELGAQFAVLTNGSQFILFRPYLPGRAWTFGIAIVFHDHSDIIQDFAYFFRLLSREQVVSGALLDAFEEAEGITETLYAPTIFLDNVDEELIRNPFWTSLSRVMVPLLTDEPENPAAQEEIIRNCYVTTRLSDQADKNLNQLLQDIPGALLKQAGVEDTGVTKSDIFAHQFERDIERYRPGTYILTGGVGSGKTTFLSRFALVVDPAFLKHYCIWLQIDFLPIGNVDINTQDERIVSYVYQQIRTKIEKEYPDKVPQSGEAIRELFIDQLDRVKKTRLYGVPEGSPEWIKQIGEVIDALYTSDSDFVTSILRSLVRRGLRLVIVLDNTDQLGEQFQERIFLFAQRLSQEHKALCIVTLREERFFAAFRRGIFDAFGIDVSISGRLN